MIVPMKKVSLIIMGDKKTGTKFVAYFQAFTNTYGPVSKLRRLYTEALDASEIIGISIATRPDCLGPDVLALLKELKKTYSHKFIWIELGLQTIHAETARYIRRGYDLAVFTEAANALHTLDIPFIVHVILGLPGEMEEDVKYTVSEIKKLAPDSLTVHSLAILSSSGV